MEVFLALINHSFLLIFGTVLSIDFSGVVKTKRNKRITVLLIGALLVTQVISLYTIGSDMTLKVYPIITHLPIVLTLVFCFKRRWLAAIVSVCSAYLCCQTPRWFGMLAVAIWNTRLSGLLTNTLCIIPTLYLLERYVVPSAVRLINQNRKLLLLFGAMPTLFYAFAYFATVYTNVLYDGSKIAVEFIPSVTALLYFAVVIIYDAERQRRNDAETEAILMQHQADEAKQQIALLYTTQEQAAAYRHDLRHHLSLLGSFAESGDMEKIKEYISAARGELDVITPTHYCINQTVNLILSAFDNQAKAKGVTLLVDAQLPEELSIPDTELCAVLSNGLENALNAVSHIENATLRTVQVNCFIKSNNLMLMIRNPYTNSVNIKNGIPISTQEGHGFGCRSIASIAEKRKGHSTFVTADGVFTLRVILPM